MQLVKRSIAHWQTGKPANRDAMMADCHEADCHKTNHAGGLTRGY